MKKLLSVTLLAVALLLALTACNSNSLIRPADSLLKPPLYYDEYQGLVDSFRAVVGSETVFCNPYSGNYRSAITVKDIDGDSQNEAVVFYKQPSAAEINEQLIKMQYFDLIGGEWVSLSEVSGHGDGVESVAFSDMDSDGILEVFVSWSTSTAGSGSFISLYKFDEPSMAFKEVFGENCMAYLLLDVDGDMKDDIFYISQSVVMEAAQKSARVIGLSGDSVVILGESKLDPNVSRYTLTVPEKHSGDGYFSVYVDAVKGEQQMITEFLYWDYENSELCNPLLNTETMSNTKTFRYETLSSEDINGDGKLDIPAQTPLNKTDNLNAETDLSLANENNEDIYLTTWKNFGIDGDETVVAYTLVNVNDGYMIYLNENEIDSVSVTSYPARSCWVLYSKDPVTGEETEIYSVLKIKNGSSSEELNEQYIPVIIKENETVYVYITENGTSNGIDESLISQKITKLP